MSSTFNKIVFFVSTVLSVLTVGVGGVVKLIGPPPVVNMLSKMDMGPYIRLLGIAEIALLGLFLIPRTHRIGYILLCCYFGGAIATVVSHQGSLINPALVPLIIVTVNTYTRDRQFFLSQS